MNVDSVIRILQESRSDLDTLDPPSQPGVYAFYLRDRAALTPFAPNADGLIYIGTSKNLATRELENHFNSENTGFSTLRRSLGAILRQVLKLTAIPRSSGTSRSNVRSYRFPPDGEECITSWMREHLEVGVCQVEDRKMVEEKLISELHPLLNLKGWDNPDGPAIRGLRDICAQEARANRSIGAP